MEKILQDKVMLKGQNSGMYKLIVVCLVYLNATLFSMLKQGCNAGIRLCLSENKQCLKVQCS